MTSNTYGRQVVIPMTNGSGGGVVAGDVVIVNTGANVSFTTTTSAGFTGMVGVAQETIANAAVGKVLLSGYAALINVNASVTRGNFGKTFTVAKQASDAGSSRGTGTFCQFLTGGTTPDAVVYPVDLLGTSLTNPMNAVGDIIQGTTAGAPARLGAGTAGYVLTSAGAATPLVWSPAAATGAPSTAPYITTLADAGLSAEIPRPELADFGGGSPSDIDMSAASTGTGVTANTLAGCAGRVVWSNASYQYWDVASAIATGDFDLRCRILDSSTPTGASGGTTGLVFFGVTDSGRTATTGLYVRWLTMYAGDSSMPQIQTYTGLGTTATTPVIYAKTGKYILRVVRVSTTVTRYVSFNEGASWITLGATTSSLSVAKVGLWGNPNGATTIEAVAHWVRSY